MVGTLGSMQAQMAINHILDIKPRPLGQIVSINLKNFYFSSFRFDNALEPKKSNFKFIDLTQVLDSDLVIELRDSKEMPTLISKNTKRIELSQLHEKISKFDNTKHLIFVCKSGVRSWKAAKSIEHMWNNKISLIADNNELN